MIQINNTSDVLQNDLCIGCGACVVNTSNSIKFDDNGFYKPLTYNESLNSSVCPFVDLNANEDGLSEKFIDGDK